MLVTLVNRLESMLFGGRAIALTLMVLFTGLMSYYALQLKMTAGFDKQLPTGHEYTQTFRDYEDQLLGANRLIVVMETKDGDIWNKADLSRLYELTQAVLYLPNVDRLSTTSMWTPNVYAKEITAEGFKADPLIPGDVVAEALDDAKIAEIRRLTNSGGFMGQLVARDSSSAMITVNLLEADPQTGEALNYIEFNQTLEADLRRKFEDDNTTIRIIGFAKQVGDVAEGGQSVLIFCALAVLMTALAVYWYCHSIWLTVLPIACSLASLVWQFGT
ncbi:MAG: hypothetical protein V7739_18705, partial [Motiliproteus sp.]